MRNMTIYVTLALLCTIAFTGQSADTPEKQNPIDPKIVKSNEKFEVEVSVRCDDENTKAFIESHIKRELRSLQDVEIADTGRYRLSILAIEFTYKTSGRKSGEIALAYVVERRFNAGPTARKLLDAYEAGTKDYDEAIDMVLDFLHLRDKVNLGLQVGMTDDLDKICKGIVVDFDTERLEPDRNGK
ncbi:MAG: hypothetical protein OXN27_20860 [Candidatus Poribacteria bacterium]|nr:hypothetical protein [Candidatus Poribacteria bacterium]